MGLMEIASTLLTSVNPEAAKKAKSEFSRYSPDINGLRQAISDWGGMVMVDKAVEFVSSHPRVNGYLQKAGINPAQIRSQLQDQTYSNIHADAVQSNNAYKDRLSKLK